MVTTNQTCLRQGKICKVCHQTKQALIKYTDFKTPPAGHRWAHTEWRKTNSALLQQLINKLHELGISDVSDLDHKVQNLFMINST